MKGNSWSMAYDAVVIGFGTVCEGRAGGVNRTFIGAHAKGFNTRGQSP